MNLINNSLETVFSKLEQNEETHKCMAKEMKRDEKSRNKANSY